jgi:amino acid transporter
MNIAGAAIAGIGQLILVLMLVGIMLVFGIWGIFRGMNMDNFTPFMPNGVGGFSACIPIATFAYMGAACICTAGSECKDPKDLGRALVWSSLTFIFVYCLALFVVLGTINWRDASLDVSIFTVAAEILWGPIGASIRRHLPYYGNNLYSFPYLLCYGKRRLYAQNFCQSKC